MAMSGKQNQVHLGNYIVSKESIALALRERFGPCTVTDVFKSKSDAQAPYGFAEFEQEQHALACVAARRIMVDGVTILLSPGKPRNGKQDSRRKNVDRLSNSDMQGGARNVMSGQGDSLRIEVPYAGNSSSLANGASHHQPEVFNAIISHSNGMDEIYIQDIRGDNPQQYVVLHTQINQYCPTAPVAPKVKREKLYGGLFSADNAWYRCKVIDKVSDDAFKVIFVDYGNADTVSRSNLKELTPELEASAPAASKHHIRDLIPKPHCEQHVNDLMAGWHEIILECELSEDGSVNLTNKETQVSLRATLVNSGYVTLPPSHKASPAAKGQNARAKRGADTAASRNLSNTSLSQQQTAATSQQNRSRTMNEVGSSVALDELKKKKADLEKKLKSAQNEIHELRSTNLDELTKTLHEQILRLRESREKLPTSQDSLLNRAISFLSTDPGSDDHKPTFSGILQPVIDAQSEYLSLQEQLRSASSIGDAEQKLIEQRNKAREELVEAVNKCESENQQLLNSGDRSQIAEVLMRLMQTYPEAAKEESNENTQEFIDKFVEWQDNEGPKVQAIMETTDKALGQLSQNMTSFQQILDLASPVPAVPPNFQLQKLLQNAIEKVQAEITANQLLQQKRSESHDIIFCLCSAVCTQLRLKLAQLDEAYDQLSTVKHLAETLQPWVKAEAPDMEKVLSLRKTLKAHKSSLRHRQADLLDIQENEDGSDSEMAKMEEVVRGIQQEIHGVLIQLEEELETLANLAWDVFPELNVKYADLCLTDIRYNGGNIIKPLREITFYETKDQGLTTFAGMPVLIKAYSCQTANEIPDAVASLLRQSDLMEKLNIDALFYSKNGREIYVQISSKYPQVLQSVKDLHSPDAESLSAKLAQLNLDLQESEGTSEEDEEDAQQSDDTDDDVESHSGIDIQRLSDDE